MLRVAESSIVVTGVFDVGVEKVLDRNVDRACRRGLAGYVAQILI